MLHDPRHDKTPTLAGFALFVASKPAYEKYEWRHCDKCAVGQYLHSIGMFREIGWDGDLDVANTLAAGRSLLTTNKAKLLLNFMISKNDWTFGQLADRILEYQREH
jgi:hypothetical protein